MNTVVIWTVVMGAIPLAHAKDCSQAIQIATKSLLQAKENAKKKDVSSFIEDIETWAKECKLKLNEIGTSHNALAELLLAGYEAEINRAYKTIERHSSFRNVDAEAGILEDYSKKAGYDLKDVKPFIEFHKKNGSEAEIRERKSCQTPIDLRSEKLGPVRDQDSVGWCYAYSAADLLSYKLGKKVSAADIALKYNDHWFKNILKRIGMDEQKLEGGETDRAIRSLIKKGGACLESNLKSEDTGISDLYTNIKQIKKKSPSSCTAAAQNIFPHLAEENIKQLIEGTAQHQLVRTMSDAACAPRISLDDVQIKKREIGSWEELPFLFEEIDQQLAKNNICSISYNAQILYEEDPKKVYGHGSAVVGRRFNAQTHECEYLIRNSWGRGCEEYDSSLPCEEGNLWISKSRLAGQVYDVTYLE